MKDAHIIVGTLGRLLDYLDDSAYAPKTVHRALLILVLYICYVLLQLLCSSSSRTVSYW